MEFINLVIIGTAGYILLFIYDLSQLYNKPFIRYMSSVGFLLTALPYVIVMGNHQIVQLTLHEGFILLGLVLFTMLLLYSVLIEIPLYYHRNASKKVGNTNPEVYCHGTYSFSRHPGFIWYTCINMLFTVCDSQLLLLMIVLTSWNFFLILIEDRFIFPKTFIGYDTYKRNVPFILSFKNIKSKGRS